MNTAKALGLLRDLGTPALSTSDAAARLGLSVAAASKTLRRLEAAGLAVAVRRGVWTLHRDVEPLALVEYVSAPHPAYVSLQTSLHLHGMIEQIPAVVYAVTLGRSRRVRTAHGTISFHRIAPSFFGGFEVSRASGAKIASAEKALLDVCYLSGGRSRPFSTLPELTLPRGFRRSAARRWIARIASARLRTLVTRRFAQLTAVPSQRARTRARRSRTKTKRG